MPNNNVLARLIPRQKTGPSDVEDDSGEFSPPLEPPRGSTVGAHLISSGVRWVLVVAVVCGPVALVTHRHSGPASAPAPSQVVAGAVPEAARGLASETATNAVVAWLTTPSARVEEVQRLFPGVQDLRLPQKAAVVGRVAVVNAVPAANGVWRVVVAADVQQALTDPASVDPGQNDAPSVVRRYWRLPVYVGLDGGVAVAQALPAAVPAPPRQDPQELAYRVDVPPSGPLATTAAGFLAALVTGETEEATRFAAPGLPVMAIQPPAASGLRLVGVTVRREDRGAADGDGLLPAGQLVRLRVRVDLLDERGDARSGEYFLTAAVRDGRWEITGLDDVPQLADEASSASSPSSSGPAGSTGSAGSSVSPQLSPGVSGSSVTPNPSSTTN